MSKSITLPERLEINGVNWQEWWDYVKLKAPACWPEPGRGVGVDGCTMPVFNIPMFEEFVYGADDVERAHPIEESQANQASRLRQFIAKVEKPMHKREEDFKAQAPSMYAWVLGCFSEDFSVRVRAKEVEFARAQSSVDGEGVYLLIDMARIESETASGVDAVEGARKVLSTIRQRGYFSKFERAWTKAVKQLEAASEEHNPHYMAQLLLEALDPEAFKRVIEDWKAAGNRKDYAGLWRATLKHYESFKAEFILADVESESAERGRKGAREHDAVRARAVAAATSAAADRKKIEGKVYTNPCRDSRCKLRGQVHQGKHEWISKDKSASGVHRKQATEGNCFKCDKPGHFIADCPEWKTKPSGKPSSKTDAKAKVKSARIRVEELSSDDEYYEQVHARGIACDQGFFFEEKENEFYQTAARGAKAVECTNEQTAARGAKTVECTNEQIVARGAKTIEGTSGLVAARGADTTRLTYAQVVVRSTHTIPETQDTVESDVLQVAQRESRDVADAGAAVELVVARGAETIETAQGPVVARGAETIEDPVVARIIETIRKAQDRVIQVRYRVVPGTNTIEQMQLTGSDGVHTVQREYRYVADAGTVVTERDQGVVMTDDEDGQEKDEPVDDESDEEGCYPDLSETVEEHHQLMEIAANGFLYPYFDQSQSATYYTKKDSQEHDIRNIRALARSLAHKQSCRAHDASTRLGRPMCKRNPRPRLRFPPRDDDSDSEEILLTRAYIDKLRIHAAKAAMASCMTTEQWHAQSRAQRKHQASLELELERLIECDRELVYRYQALQTC